MDGRVTPEELKVLLDEKYNSTYKKSSRFYLIITSLLVIGMIVAGLIPLLLF